MKQILLAVCTFLSVALTANAHNSSKFYVAQADTTGEEKALVKVTSWGSRAIYLLGNDYFKETKDEIIKQLGQAKFEDMQKKCSSAGWPSAMNDVDGEEAAVDTKMNKLTMYKIASYQHKFNGNVFDRYAIIEVPYTDNVNWDTNVVWEGSVYFLIKETDVEAVK